MTAVQLTNQRFWMECKYLQSSTIGRLGHGSAVLSRVLPQQLKRGSLQSDVSGLELCVPGTDREAEYLSQNVGHLILD